MYRLIYNKLYNLFPIKSDSSSQNNFNNNNKFNNQNKFGALLEIRDRFRTKSNTFT